MTTYWLAGIAVIFISVLYYAALPKPIPGIPYNKKHARNPFGAIPDILRHVRKHNTITDLMCRVGRDLDTPIFQLFFAPFSKPAVFITDFREGHDILTKRAPEFDRSKFFGDFFQGLAPDHHIHMPTNARWKAQRRLLADTMSLAFLSNVAVPHFEREIHQLIELWRIKSQTGRAFAAAEDILHMSLDTIWAVGFGSQIGTVKTQIESLQDIKVPVPTDDFSPVIFPAPQLPADYHAIITVTDSVTAAAQSPLPKLAHWWTRQLSPYKVARARVNHFSTLALDSAKRRLLTGQGDDSMIRSAADNMVRREQQAAAKEEREPEYDTAVTRDELLGFLVAGHDTSASSVMWGVKHLADNPDAQTALRKALKEAHPGANIPSGDSISKAQVPYLDAVIEEVLRLARVAPSHSRRALRDVMVLGRMIPKDTDVFILPNGPGFISKDIYADRIDETSRSATAREAKDRVGVWNDPELFNPERWLKTDEKGQTIFDPRAGPSLPFGGGPRGCFGRKLALLELKCLYTFLIWSFELRKVPEALSGYASVETLTNQPKQCYVLPVPIRN